jgi:hypothetical protein
MDASMIPIARLDALRDDAPAHAEADGKRAGSLDRPDRYRRGVGG